MCTPVLVLPRVHDDQSVRVGGRTVLNISSYRPGFIDAELPAFSTFGCKCWHVMVTVWGVLQESLKSRGLLLVLYIMCPCIYARCQICEHRYSPSPFPTPFFICCFLLLLSDWPWCVFWCVLELLVTFYFSYLSAIYFCCSVLYITLKFDFFLLSFFFVPVLPAIRSASTVKIWNVSNFQTKSCKILYSLGIQVGCLLIINTAIIFTHSNRELIYQNLNLVWS